MMRLLAPVLFLSASALQRTMINKNGVEVACSGDPYCDTQPYIECCPQGPDTNLRSNPGSDDVKPLAKIKTQIKTDLFSMPRFLAVKHSRKKRNIFSKLQQQQGPHKPIKNDEHRFLSTKNSKGFIGSLVNAASAGLSTLTGGMKTCAGGGMPAPIGSGSQATFSDKQACVACKFVWTQVNMGKSKDSTPDLVGQAFDNICADAPDVFYQGCDDMYDQIDFMIKDSLNKGTVDKICGCARLCAPDIVSGGAAGASIASAAGGMFRL